MTKKYFIAALITILTMAARPTIACDCELGSIEDEIKFSQLLVTGQVMSKTVFDVADTLGTYANGTPRIFTYQKAKYTIQILQDFKGKLVPKTVTVITGVGGGDCGFDFIVGQKYIIYGFKRTANDKSDVYETNICTRTTEYNDKAANEIKKVLKK